MPVMLPLGETANPGGRLAAENASESLSGSENMEATEMLMAPEIHAVLLGRLPATGLRFGGVTVQVNDPVTEPPRPSLAVICVVNGLEAFAVLEIVPEMSPAEEIDRPVGSPVAVKVRVSESGSENADLTDKLIWLELDEDWFAMLEKIGFRFGGITVHVNEPVTVPPRPSDAVI